MHLEVRDADAHTVAEAAGDREVFLAWEGVYAPGYTIVMSGLVPAQFYKVRVDAGLAEALVYITKDTVCYHIPFGEGKTGHPPQAFTGERHYLSIRMAETADVCTYRNLALNPLDQHGDQAEGIYPHASANVETRGEAVFAARNAIDGVIAPLSHGEWPYSSWGINRDPNAALTLDFGRSVDIERICLYTRADFPHDSYWTGATFIFSDGSQERVEMVRETVRPHVFEGPRFCKKGITRITLQELIKAADESPFPALTQIEVYGRESGISRDQTSI
ncbi:MAG: carbohydrate-binding protein [Butyrivibrio sp.]|nr:carbohydrate-binding protein [Butyrivibrio sp.]